MRDRAFPREVCGRALLCEGTPDPAPTLTEKELVDVCRDDTEGAREEDVDEEKDGFRERPTMLFPFMNGLIDLELGCGFIFDVSPALSARVFRFGGGSGTENC